MKEKETEEIGKETNFSLYVFIQANEEHTANMETKLLTSLD